MALLTSFAVSNDQHSYNGVIVFTLYYNSAEENSCPVKLEITGKSPARFLSGFLYLRKQLHWVLTLSS